MDRAGTMTPLRRGWAPGPDDAYPDDLPEDWRLTYLANLLDAVLVPAELWSEAVPATLEQWLRDTPDGFGFYLEDPAGQMTPARWQRLRGALGERLRGLVSTADDAPAEADPLAPWRFGSSAGANLGRCVRVPRALRADLSPARGWVEALARASDGQPTVLLLDDAAIALAHQWQIMLDLLGIPRR
jgi:hypothetical protein